MERKIQQGLFVLATLLAAAGMVVVVSATTEHAAQLPSSANLGCANCHVGATATTAPNTALNVFGQAFRDNGSVWDARLARLDSDADGCTNGTEIGDSDGGGQPDQLPGGSYVDHQSGNPGEAGDCAATTNESTWGALKSLFNTN